MQFTDTHTHLYLPEFDADQNEVINRAVSNGVTKMYLPNIDSTSIKAMNKLTQSFPENCFPMMGLHPCSVKENFEEELNIVEHELFHSSKKYFGVGECGLDLYWDKTFIKEQKIAFIRQLHWSVELSLPFIIHSRDATDECIELIESENLKSAFGIFHCFSGTIDQAKKIIDLGFYLSIGGVVTFKNGGLDKVVPQLSLNYLVLETDSPYLAPVPHRGKRNESSYINIIASKVAALKNCTIDEVANTTTENAKKLFG